MANKNVNVKHIMRNDTRDNWLRVNPTLSLGEMGVETDTFKIKIGNGTDKYSTLPYINGSSVSRIETQKVVATSEGQKVFKIPFSDFNSAKCYVDVRINSTWISPEKYSIAGTNITFTSGKPNGSSVFITCHYLENVDGVSKSYAQEDMTRLDSLEETQKNILKEIEELKNILLKGGI